jgi:hypothetical protein
MISLAQRKNHLSCNPSMAVCFFFVFFFGRLQVLPRTVPDHSDQGAVDWTSTSDTQAFVIGEAALRLPQDAPFDLLYEHRDPHRTRPHGSTFSLLLLLPLSLLFSFFFPFRLLCARTGSQCTAAGLPPASSPSWHATQWLSSGTQPSAATSICRRAQTPFRWRRIFRRKKRIL